MRLEKCKECGKEFTPSWKHQVFCSPQCKHNYYYKPTDFVKCRTCGKEFSTRRKNQAYCSPQCRSEYYDIQHPTEKRICKVCGKEFSTRRINQAYCSKECWYINHSQQHKHYDKRICKYCGEEFWPTRKQRIFCSVKCLGLYTQGKVPLEKRREYAREYQASHKPQKSNYENFGNLRLWTELDFENWFKNNFVLFGIKNLFKIDRFFPDVLAETYDGRMIRVELELNAVNFVAHQHDPNECDLIISFVKPRRKKHVKGVPVISIFDTEISGNLGENNYDPDSLRLTDYFQAIVDKCVRSLHTYLRTADHSGKEEGEIE